ncbi:transposase domain-containing protein [Agrobacterium rhizogenes]|nr:transposase domain-containing protein [Rhizobium rhizogenes]NTG54040.1 transposase domain-containing protein [Rhizobium rhizogenes]
MSVTRSILDTREGYLTTVLTAIVNGHKQGRIDELLPWNYPVE